MADPCASSEDPPNTPRCSICLQHPHDTHQSIVPSCGHGFCAKCVLSWSQVRSNCPLCKSAFSSLLVRRLLDGQVVTDGGWVEEPTALLSRARWVHLNPVNNRVEEMQGVFVHPHGSNEVGSSSSAYSAGTTLSQWVDEEMEEEREKQFWEEEEREWEEHRRGVRWLGNRRFGQNGYVSAGRMMARPARSIPGLSDQPCTSNHASNCNGQKAKNTRRKKKKKKKNKSNRAGSASTSAT